MIGAPMAAVLLCPPSAAHAVMIGAPMAIEHSLNLLRLLPVPLQYGATDLGKTISVRAPLMLESVFDVNIS